MALTVVRPGLIEISPDEGVKESWPSCSLLECAGFRVLVDLGHPKEGPDLLLSALRALGPRVYVRHFPGHTPGSLAVFACVGGRVHALAGDIILIRDYGERAIPPGSSWKPELIPEQMGLIAARADVIVPGQGDPFECRQTGAQTAQGRMLDPPGTGPAPSETRW